MGSDNHRYVKIEVSLDNSDGVNQYSGCSVELIESDLKEIVSIVGNSATADVDNDKKPKCSFYLCNHKFLGSVRTEVTFAKKGETVLNGDSNSTKVRVPFVFTAHENDPDHKAFQNENLRDLAISYEDGCVAPGGYLVKDKDGITPCNSGETVLPHLQKKLLPKSFAKRGKVSLKLTGVFLDTRYRVLSESGAENMKGSYGDFLIRKEGLELDAKYLSFNDASKDKTTTGGDGSINLTPMKHTHYKKHTSTVMQTIKAGKDGQQLDYSNKGQALDSNGAPQLPLYFTTDIDSSFGSQGTSDKDSAYKCDKSADPVNRGCFSQMLLSTVVEFEYGELPHFQPGYIACTTICHSQLVIKGIAENDGQDDVYRIHTRLTLSAEDLPVAPDTFSFLGISLLPKQEIIFEDYKPFKFTKLFSVQSASSNLQRRDDDGDSDQIENLDVHIPFEEYLVTSAVAPDGSTTVSSTIPFECQKLINLKLHDLETDIVAGFTRVLEDCYLTMPKNFFGTKQKLSWNGGSESTVIEHDDRVIAIVDPSTNEGTALSLTRRVRAGVTTVGSAIRIDLTKSLPDVEAPAGTAYPAGSDLKDKRITFRLKANSNAMEGFIIAPNGHGYECAGLDTYWKDESPRKYQLYFNGLRSYKAYGTCEDASGVKIGTYTTREELLTDCTNYQNINGEDRCFAPVSENTYNLPTYDDCKDQGGVWKIVSVPHGTEELGDSSVNIEGVSGECTGPAVQEEVLLRTSEVNGLERRHWIRSTPACNGLLDLQFEDQTEFNDFAIYKARIDCSRVSTNTVSDSVNMKFKFSSSLNLQTNTFEALAEYTNNVGYDVSVDIGTCNNDGSFNDDYSHKGTCIIDDQYTISNIEGSPEKEITINSLDAFMDCATSVTKDDTSKTYVIEYDLAMKYERDASSSQFSNSVNYCDDQRFTATINREATASVTAANPKTIPVERQAIVKDIAWTQDGCSSASEYRLEVLLAVKEADDRVSAGSKTWEKTRLTNAFMNPSMESQNPNNMMIHAVNGKTVIDSSSGASATIENSDIMVQDPLSGDAHNLFKVKGACVVVTACDLLDDDNTQDGNSWKDFSNSFSTDVVVRGKFLEREVDTALTMTLNYQECPIEGQAVVTGAVRLGLSTTCSDQQNADTFYTQSVAQPMVSQHWDGQSDDTNVKFDCTEAYYDDVVRVEGFEFVGKEGCSDTASDPTLTDAQREAVGGDAFDEDCALLQDERSQATTQGWEAESVKVFVDRYDTSTVPHTSVSSTQVCQCSSGSCSVSPSPNIPGLPAFNRISIGGDFKQYLACGLHGSEQRNAPGYPGSDTGNNMMKHQIPLRPLLDAPLDQFVIRYDVVMKNTKAPSRRRRLLRTSMPLRSSSGTEVEGSSRGVKIINVDSEQYGGSSSASESSSTDHTHENDHSHDSEMVLLIVILSILGAGAIVVALYMCNCGKMKDDDDESSGESQSLVTPSREQRRFKNLRY